MDFSLSDDHRMIRQSIRRLCEKEPDPIAGEIDREERFPMAFYRRLGEIGGGTSEIQKMIVGRVLMRE